MPPPNSAELPEIDWEDIEYGTTRISQVPELAARYRLEGTNRWVSVRLELGDILP